MVFSYNIIYSSRRSISIIVSPHKGVTVRAPYRTPLKTIEKFVGEKSSWITKHLEKHKELNKLSQDDKTFDGALLPYLGKEKKLQIIRSEKTTISESPDSIIINMTDPGDRKLAGLLIKKWYRFKAENYLPQRFREILLQHTVYGFNPTGLKIRSLKSRWGSCSSKGSITLNSDLVKLEERFVDYVICHELCHLIHHNHSARYYSLLSEVYPDWKNTRKQLKSYIR